MSKHKRKLFVGGLTGVGQLVPMLAGTGLSIMQGLEAEKVQNRNEWMNKIMTQQMLKAGKKASQQGMLATYPTDGVEDADYYEAMGGNLHIRVPKKAKHTTYSDKYAEGGKLLSVRGKVKLARGRTHEEGGIDLGNDEVEDNEVIYEDKVYSNRIGDGTGKSFATEAMEVATSPKYARFVKRDEKGLSPLDIVFNKQEEMKAKTGYANPNYHAFGDRLNSMFSNIQDGLESKGGQAASRGLMNLMASFMGATPLVQGASVLDPEAYKGVNGAAMGAGTGAGSFLGGLFQKSPMGFANGGRRRFYGSGGRRGTNLGDGMVDEHGVSLPLYDYGITPMTYQTGAGLPGATSPAMTPVTTLAPEMSFKQDNTADLNGQSLYKAKQLGQGVLEGVNKLAPYADNIMNWMLTKRLPNVPAPATINPVNLDTTHSIAAPLDEDRANLSAFYKNIDQNTVQSNAGRANKIAAFARSTRVRNDLFTNKENIETGLRNQAATINAEIDARNKGTMNKFADEKLQRELDISERKSENVANLVEDIGYQGAERNLKALDQSKLRIIEKRFADTGVAVDLMEDPVMQQHIRSLSPEARLKVKDMIKSKQPSSIALWNRLFPKDPITE